MSQRLISQISIDKASELSRFFQPIGYRKNGKPIFLIGGASEGATEGGAGSDGSEGSGESGGAGNAGEGGTGGAGTDSGSGGGGSGDGTDTVSKAEFEALKNRMQAADRRASAAEAKVKEFEDKGKDELTKQQERVQALETDNSKLQEENRGLKAKLAFLSSSEHQWHDPDVALSQVDLSEVMSEDGNVDKKLLKAKMDSLAKEKPFLVKSADSGGSGGSGGRGSSGAPVGSGGSGGGRSNSTDEALKKKYPALR